MKTQKTRYARFFALAVALASLFAIVPAASAQYTSPDSNRDGYSDGYSGRRDLRGQSYDQSYERMRQYARQLDELAREANRQAQRSQAGYRSFRRDTKFLREIRDFAARASQFRARMETYQTRAWAVDDELAVLLRDARDVEERIRRARFVDRPTVADWNRAVGLLNQMTTEYQAGIGYRGGYPYPDRDYSYDRVPGSNYGNYGSSTDLRQLARELDQRASRASQLATGYTGYSSGIRQFSEQANDFRDHVETNRMNRSELRSEVNRLLEDADAAYSELRQRNVSREVASEWSAIVQILNRMRDLAV